VHKLGQENTSWFIFFYNLHYISNTKQPLLAAETVAGDMSRRKKVKEKRPSPLLFPPPLSKRGT
jgi:hypothetical protein